MAQNMESEPGLATIPQGVTDRQLLEMIWVKLSSIDNINEKIVCIETRMDSMEEKLAQIETQHEDLHKGTSFIETEFEEQKHSINEIKDEMVSKEEFQKLKYELVDMSNMMRRNKVLFYNIPEKLEGSDCTGYINSLIQKIDCTLEVGTAYRRPIYNSDLSNRDKPRPIHAWCVRKDDRDKILQDGPAIFKENLLDGNRVFVSDDVHPVTREIHKKLLEKQKEFRAKEWMAYIPWKVPRILKYRQGQKGTKAPVKVYKITQ